METDLHRRLHDEFGPVLGGQELVKALGFKSAEALRRAVVRGDVGVKTFQLPGRKGRFALTEDVARWLVEARDGGRAPPDHQGAIGDASVQSNFSQQVVNRPDDSPREESTRTDP